MNQMVHRQQTKKRLNVLLRRKAKNVEHVVKNICDIFDKREFES